MAVSDAATISDGDQWAPLYAGTNPSGSMAIFTATTAADSTAVATTASTRGVAAPNIEGGRVGKPARRRSRASRRAPTTLLNTDTANFRAMVQQFTGVPSRPYNSGPAGGPPINFTLNQPTPPPYGNPAGYHDLYNYFYQQQQQQQQSLGQQLEDHHQHQESNDIYTLLQAGGHNNNTTNMYLQGFNNPDGLTVDGISGEMVARQATTDGRAVGYLL